MAFSGGTSTSFGTPGTGFGATPNTGFNFGGAQTQPAFGTSTQPAFGTSTQPAFGAATQPAFGTPSQQAFGTPTQPAFGTPTNTGMGFGSGFGGTNPPFGTPSTSANSNSLFGASKPAETGGLFGSPAGFGQSAGGGLFGSSNTAAVQPFGATTTTSSFTFGSTPAATSTTSLFGSSGTGLFSTGTNLFGSAATTSTPSLFGSSTGGSLFGAAGQQTAGVGTGLFGSSGTTGGLFSGSGGSSLFQGAKPAFGTGFSSFSTPQPLQQQQQQQGEGLDALLSALFCPKLFNDDRDKIIAKWNQLQAAWGTGKGFFSGNNPPVDFTPDNQFCRFKAVGYSCLPKTKNEDGLVALVFNKSCSEVTNQQEALVSHLHKVFGSKPHIQVCVESVRGAPDCKTEVIIYLQERQPSGIVKRILASELFNYLQQASTKTQLVSIAVGDIFLRCAPSDEDLKQYLENPPKGLDPLIWEQAKLDNPNSKELIPVPMIGFTELQRRLKLQESETKQHQGRLDLIADCITDLNRKHVQNEAKIRELKHKHLELSHRVLQVMGRQEVCRKLGTSIQADEEQFKMAVDNVHAKLSAPNQFKGRLNELLSQIRMQSQLTSCGGENINIDAGVADDLKQILRTQQRGLNHLISIIRDDFHDLKTITDGLNEISSKAS